MKICFIFLDWFVLYFFSIHTILYLVFYVKMNIASPRNHVIVFFMYK